MNLFRVCTVAGGAVGLAAACLLAGPDTTDPAAERDKILQQEIAKGDGSAAARRALVDSVYAQTRGPANPERVVYGADDRREVYEYDTLDTTLRAMAEACAIVVDDSEVVDNGNGTYTLLTSPWTSAGGTLCLTEPFRGQPQIGFCSSFLVGQDLITTAGHCVDAGDISAGVAFVFGFQLNDSDETGPTVVPADYVYFGTSIVTQALGGGDDYSVVQLDRPVVGFNPVPIRRTGTIANGTPVAVIGHPAAILKKIAGGAEVKNNAPAGYFQSNLDTYGGNSGSMIVNLNTYEVEGILVRGAPDYTTVGGCVQTNYVPDSGSPTGLQFEEVSKTTRFESFIPPLGITVAPGGSVLHFGEVGGPFTNPSTVYTLTNTTADPADYEVSLSAVGGVLINGGTSTITGTLPASGTTMVTVSLDNTFVNALPAGVTTVDVTFEDTTNSIASTAAHIIEVGQTLITVSPATGLTTGGPVGGPFPGSAAYTVTSQRPTPVDVLVDGPSWIDFAVTRSEMIALTGTGDSATVTITIGGDAASLPAGLYSDTVTFTNLDNAAEVSIPVTLDVGRYIYAATDVPVTITDNAVFTSQVVVNESFCIGDVDVDIDLTHTFSADLIITLTSPQGTVVGLHNEGGGSADFTPRRWDDEPGHTLPEGPGTLADFDAELATGTWTLTVEDDAGGDTGTLHGWALRVASSGDICPPFAADGVLIVEENLAATTMLSASSADPDPLTYTITSLPASGVLWDPGAGSITSVPTDLTGDTVTYRATPGNVGADAFGFTATVNSQTSNTGSVAVTIEPFGDAEPLHSFPLDTNPGWTTEGLWAFGVPTGQGGASSSGPDPTSGYTGTNVYGYNLNGNYENNLPPRYLTTPDLSVAGAGNIAVSFRRWLGIESSIFDKASFDVRADAGPWQTVWEHTGGSFGDNAWTLQSYDIAAIADGASTIAMRWRMGATDSSVQYPGWNLDDIEITGILASGNPADLDGNGTVNLDDLDLFIAQFFAGQPLADLNGDGLVTLDDLDAFIFYFTN